MKFIKILLLPILFIDYVVPVTVPNWVKQVNKIEKAILGLADQLVTDVELYEELIDEMEVLFGGFSDRKKNRNEALSCLLAKHKLLNKELARCGNASLTYKEQLAREILKLESELESLRTKTTKEIDNLNLLKSKVDEEHKKLLDNYNNVVGDAKDEAKQLISAMQGLQNIYNKSISQRARFLNTLGRLIERTKIDVDQEAVDMQNIENEICLKD